MEKKFSEEFAIGIDLGTGSCKTVVLGKSGEVLGIASANYAAKNISSKWKEQDPDSLYNGVISSLVKAVQSANILPDKCLGLSIGGALHSLIAINHNHQPLTGVITWADLRSKKQSGLIASQYRDREYYQRNGCPNNPMYPISKIMWIREETPDIFNEVYKFFSAKEYVIWKLTGNEIVDYAIASGTGLFNIINLEWDDELMDTAGINTNYLSKPESPLTEVGFLDSKLARQAGLCGAIPIYLGSADAVNSSIGAGTTNSDSLTCMIGTSGAIRTISQKPILDKKERLWCYAIERQLWLVGGSINNGGLALDWLRSLFNNLVPGNKDIGFNQLMDWASEIQPGSEGLFCLPFLTNERSPYWNPNMRAVLFGLTLKHDHRHIARSFLEGISFRLKSVLEAIQEVFDIEFSEIKASGGFTVSPIWIQILADVLNQNISIPTNDETSAVGAAYWVLQANQIVKNLDDMKNLVGVSKIYCPKPEYRSQYDKTYPIYKELYFSSRDIFDKIQ